MNYIELKELPKVSKLLDTEFLHANIDSVAHDSKYRKLHQLYKFSALIKPSEKRDGSVSLSVSYDITEPVRFLSDHPSYPQAQNSFLLKLNNFLEKLEIELV